MIPIRGRPRGKAQDDEGHVCPENPLQQLAAGSSGGGPA